MLLYDKIGYAGAARTACKTWSCIKCKKSLVSYFNKRVRYASRQEQSYFITVTFKMGKDRLRDAEYAEAKLTAWLRTLRKRYTELTYVKVPELTKKGQIHYHLMSTGIGDLTSSEICCGKQDRGKHLHKKNQEWLRKVCYCLEHVFARAWYEITGDSFIVQVDRVYNAKGAGSYLSKYFSKGFGDRGDLEARGFKRRYSFSRNFPKLERMQYLGTKEEQWVRVERLDKPPLAFERRLLDRMCDNTDLEKVGELYEMEEAATLEIKQVTRRVNALISQVLRSEDNSVHGGRGNSGVPDPTRRDT